MRARLFGSVPQIGITLLAALLFTTNARSQDSDPRDRDDIHWGQHTAGVLSRVGIEQYPVGCSGPGGPADPKPWSNAAGERSCSKATEEDNVDGLVVLVNWRTLQPDYYDEPLKSYYIDNIIYSMVHPERQSIRLGVLTGIRSPDWLETNSFPSVIFPDAFGPGMCDPSAGGPSMAGAPGAIWNTWSIGGNPHSMPNPFGSNTCFLTALDNVVRKLGQTGDYFYPVTPPYPQPLAPYDDLYYDSAPGREGFVHTNAPTRTMNKIIGHVSVLGPSSYDDESVLCQLETECENTAANAPNVNLWQSLEPDDFSMEAAIEDAQKKAIDIYARHFPATYWTVDLTERQMPFFTADGCRVSDNPYPPTSKAIDAADSSDCFGKLRTDLIDYIEARYFWHGGVQNNSLSADPTQLANHPVWKQTALAAQGPPLNPVKLFAGFEVGQPADFYKSGDLLFKDFEADDQGAVNLAKQMLPCYRQVDFIEFYDVDIANDFALAPIDGSTPATLIQVNKPISALNDDPNGVTSGGFMHVPLTDAHFSLRANNFYSPMDCRTCTCKEATP